MKMLISLILFEYVTGQGILPNGDPYFCTPLGTCSETGGIEPRIITPDETIPSCPEGLEICYAQGINSKCGLRKTNKTSNEDGEAPYGSFPWQAFLTDSNGTFIGSGSLISPYHVLTATHKVLSYVSNPSQVTVIMGVNDPAEMEKTLEVISIKAANIDYLNTSSLPYSNKTLKNDIAIIRLSTPISLVSHDSVNTICLPPSTTNPEFYMNQSQRCVVSGWGQIEPTNDLVPTKLKQVYVNTTDIMTCANGFAGKINVDMYLDKTGGQICAGGEAQKDACFQDGGSPLTCGVGTNSSRFTVAGIVIWGKSCGQPGIYGVYTNVPFYRQWIMEIITTKIP